jgi:hypothetical protein
MLKCWSTEDWSSFLSFLQNCALVGCNKLFHEQCLAQLSKWSVLVCLHGDNRYVTIHCLPSLTNILHMFP